MHCSACAKGLSLFYPLIFLDCPRVCLVALTWYLFTVYCLLYSCLRLVAHLVIHCLLFMYICLLVTAYFDCLFLVDALDRCRVCSGYFSWGPCVSSGGGWSPCYSENSRQICDLERRVAGQSWITCWAILVLAFSRIVHHYLLTYWLYSVYPDFIMR